VSTTTTLSSVTPAEMVSEINNEHRAAHGAYKAAVTHAIKAGELLLSAKSRIPHGEWLSWVQENCEFSQRTATGYMKLALLPTAKRQRVADFSLRQALTEIAEPKKIKSMTRPAKVPDSIAADRKAEDAPGEDLYPKEDADLHVFTREQAASHHQDDVVEHHHVDAGGSDGDPSRQRVVEPDDEQVTGRASPLEKLADIKVMPTGYWRDHPEVQPQLLAHLIESWDEASDKTRREFFLILNGRDELMPVVNAMVRRDE
jgi:hypothetical protein